MSPMARWSGAAHAEMVVDSDLELPSPACGVPHEPTLIGWKRSPSSELDEARRRAGGSRDEHDRQLEGHHPPSGVKDAPGVRASDTTWSMISLATQRSYRRSAATAAAA